MDWTEKYRPQHLEDLVGNAQILQAMIAWARTWSPLSRPLLLFGRPGTGKTSSAHALARDMGWDLIELNASDQRTKAALDKVAGSSALTASLTGAMRKLILVDEVDNLHGTADRGGAKALLDIIKKTRQPIILIANTIQDVAPELRSRCESLQFRAIQARTVIPRLRFICAAEQVRCSNTVLQEIAEQAGGDVRAAITALHAAAIGREELSSEDLQSSPKDEHSSIFDLVSAVYRSSPPEDLLRQAQSSGETPERIVQWLEGSTVHLPDLRAMVYAYRSLSRADLYLGRTRQRQYYTLWRYAQAIALIGTSDAAHGKGIHARIGPPSRWQRIGSARRHRSIRTTLLRKLSSFFHIPEQILREEYLTLFSFLVEQSPERYTAILSLDADELNLFLHNRERSVGIVKKVQEEEAKREREGIPPPSRKENATRGKQSTLF
ncbi:MAG: replication factor C large subunit [Methanomicrobiales archaeon]|nr:replication factor C large subunit [Methanomicrobiales archaeon]